MTKVKTAEQIQPALEKAFAESDDVMIEAFMDGIELANGCYKTKDKSVVFPITEVVSKNEFFDYNAKYNGEVTEITPARLSPELTDRVQKLTSAVYDILGCKGIVRVDYIITEGEKINMLEINTTPNDSNQLHPSAGSCSRYRYQRGYDRYYRRFVSEITRNYVYLNCD